jgi:hypothetical protein
MARRPAPPPLPAPVPSRRVAAIRWLLFVAAAVGTFTNSMPELERIPPANRKRGRVSPAPPYVAIPREV